MPEHHRIAVFRIVHGEHTPDGDTLNWEARLDTSLLQAWKMQGISAHALWSVEQSMCLLTCVCFELQRLHNIHMAFVTGGCKQTNSAVPGPPINTNINHPANEAPCALLRAGGGGVEPERRGAPAGAARAGAGRAVQCAARQPGPQPGDWQCLMLLLVYIDLGVWHSVIDLIS